MLHRVMLVVAIGAGIAHADPAAVQLFRDGRDLMKVNKVAEACDKFERSAKLEPRVGTYLNLADCRERLLQTASAWEAFENARALAIQTNDTRVAEASRRAAAVRLRLSYLVMKVDKPVAGLVIRRGDVEIDAATWNEKTPLDPADYTITATAPGFRTWSRSVKLVEKATVDVVVPPLVADPTSAPLTIPVPEQPVRPRKQPLRNVGAGAFAGVTHSEDTVLGARILAGIPVPGGALRGSLMFYTFDDTRDPDVPKTYTVGAAADYLRSVLPQIALGAGFAIGADFDRYRPGAVSTNDTSGWIAFRASPLVVRFMRGHIEAGFHVHFVLAGLEPNLIAYAAVDVFP